MRMASLLPAMARVATLRIACIAPAVPQETAQWVRRLGATIAHFPRPPVRGMRLWGERARMLATGSNLVWRKAEQRFFAAQRHEVAPHLVWLETPYLLRYALSWRATLPLVVDYWGTSGGARRDYQHARGLRRLWEWLRWRAALGGERRYARLLPYLVTVSSLDAAHFRALTPESRIWAIPNGRFGGAGEAGAGAWEPPPNPQQLIMTGDLGYRPNVDAAQYFARQILPLIQARRPEARLRLVGRDPLPAVLALARLPGVEVQGYVPDLAAAIRQAAVYILPMRLGSGIRSKLFDVFPLGKPIVSTTVGAEGLELVHNQNCLIADTAEEFARACLYVLEHEAEQRRLGAQAQRLALEVYSQANVERLVAAALGEMLQAGARSPESRWGV